MVARGKAIIEVGADTKKAETAFAGIKKAAQAMGIAFAGYQLKRFFEDASREAKEFESDLANINTLLGKSHPMYNQYRADLLGLKKDVPVLALKDLTKGLYNTISAGVDAEGAMEAMDAMSRAAAAGFTDMAGVVDGTTTVLNAYGIAAEDAMYVTDLGLKTVEKGKLTYGEYAMNISMVAGTAASASVELEDLNAAIAIATRVQRPEQAFVGLRGAILALTTRKDELREFGIEYTNFVDTIRQIKELAPDEATMRKIIPDIRAGETIKVLIQNYDELAQAQVEFGDVSGTTLEKYQERLETTEFKMAKVEAQAEELKIEIGDDLNEALVGNAEALGAVSGALDEMYPWLKDITKHFNIWDLTIFGLTGHISQFGKALGEAVGEKYVKGLLRQLGVLERVRDTLRDITGWTGGPSTLRTTSGTGIHGRVKRLLRKGYTPEQIKERAGELGYTPEQVEAGYEEYLRLKKKGKDKPKKGKPGKTQAELDAEAYERLMASPAMELALATTPEALAKEDYEQYKRAMGSAAGVGITGTAADAEKMQEEEVERIRALAETYAEYLDPTSYLIAGLKSGEMKQAIQDFAVELGTRVSEELVRKLIVMGIMAILNIATGGGSAVLGMGPQPMARGGVIKAAGGFAGVFPPRPGGYHVPFGDKLINFAEAGQPEIAAFLPPGVAGRNIILNQLMPQFNIPKPEVNVETRPVFKNQVIVKSLDPHHVIATTNVERGTVNKAITIRK